MTAISATPASHGRIADQTLAITETSSQGAHQDGHDQTMLNTRNAQKLRRQATRLKKTLLATGTACQCTSAGACQNISDNRLMHQQKCQPMAI